MDERETEQLMIQASAIDSRRITPAAVTMWAAILQNVTYERAVEAHIEFRRNSPGVYLEPGHIVQQVKIALHKHREIHGIHPAAPPGKRWAVDAMHDPKEIES